MGKMARRLIFGLLLLGMLVPGSVAATVEGSYARVQQAYDLKLILVLASVVCAELLVIGWLLHTRWKARSAEASLQRNEEELTAAEEKSSKAARAEFGGRLIQAQEQERTRIARELHDDINQRLALLANGMERVIQANGDYTKAEQTKQLRELSQLTNEIATDIQHLSHQLHPSKLHYLGLAAAVRDLCREFSRQHGIGVECNVEDLPRDLDDGVSLSLFRTLQESLRNVARHSGAREVKVELIYDSAIADSAVVKLRIDDDGIGFDPRQSKNSTGLGLVSMGERLRSVGGQFSLWSRPGNGTRVEGTVPAILKRNRSAPTPVELMSPRQF